MSPTKYLVLAALGLGALAVDSRAAEASMSNHTHAWCKSRGAEDQVLAQGDSSQLVWTPDGDVVLQPLNKLVHKIWSSGTAGAGDKVCWETSGTLAVYDAAGAKLWSQGGTGTVPEPGISATYRYSLSPWLSGCDFSARYVIDVQLTPPPIASWVSDVSHGKLWTRATACPKASQGMVGDDWCLDLPPPGEDRPIVQSPWSELVWTPDGDLVHRGTGIAAGRQIWTSRTAGAGKQICLAPTGQLTVFDQAHSPLWTTTADTSTTSSHVLGLDDCDLATRRIDDGAPVWTGPHRCPQTTLPTGSQWTAGTSDIVLLENAQARLVFQADGNLVLRSASGDEVWHSGLSGKSGRQLAFQTDGNLVIYEGTRAVWAAGQDNLGITTLDLDGCAFTLRTPTGGKWTRGGTSCPTDTITSAWSNSNSGVLTLLRTPDARLVWQGNGSLVLRTTAGSTVWSSGTGTSTGYRKVAFQDDGNLVIYDSAGSALWSTGTWQTQPVQRRLRLGDHCKLTLEDMSGHVLWTGNDSCTVMNYSFERTEGDSKFGVSLYTHLTAKDDGTARVDSATGIDVTLLGKSIELFSATAYQTESDDGSDLSTASLTIFGISNPGVNLTYEQEFFEESETYMVGPVPVHVSVGATGELGLSLKFGGAGLTLTPTAGIYATAEAGVGGECDVGGASAGVRGRLTLIELGLPITLHLYMDGAQPRYSVKGDLTLTSLSGSLELYAEAYVKICFVKVSADWSHELFGWSGVEWSKNLFDQSGPF